MTDAKTIQLWPSGASITYRESADGVYYVKQDGEWNEATPQQKRSIRIEEIAERLADREVYCCDSSLVDDMMKAAQTGELDRPYADEWAFEDIANLTPDPSDWDLEECREYLDENGIDHPDGSPWPSGEDMQEERDRLIELIEPDESEDEGDVEDDRKEPARFRSMSLNDLTEMVIRQIEESDSIDEWRDAVRDNAEPAEIYEWWRVSKYLAEKLQEAGECVLMNAYGEWWGRCTTGQGFIMDGVLQRVAASILGDND